MVTAREQIERLYDHNTPPDTLVVPRALFLRYSDELVDSRVAGPIPDYLFFRRSRVIPDAPV